MAKMADFYGLVVQFCSSKCASHIIYCKKHTVRHDDPATPARCTLFSLGWPPYCSDVEIEAVFSRAGSVTAIYLQASAGTVVKRTAMPHGMDGGRVAYVVFSQPDELDHALQMCTSGEAVRCDVERIGLGKWCEEYASARLALAALDSTVGHSVGQYDAREAEQQRTRRKLSQPDSEGWVTVTRRRTHQQSGRQENRKKRKAKELLHFYQFQQRESQREAIAELRRKFDKDKERVAELRAHRRFKPF